MKVELLVVESCPHEGPARDALERVLVDSGLDVTVSTMVIGDEVTACARGFIGSPSFFIDGNDLFPVANSTPGLACRVYPIPGGMDGVPNAETLRSALTDTVRRHVDEQHGDRAENGAENGAED